MKLQRYPEAEKALIGKGTENEDIAGGAAGYYMLGTICEKQARQKEALGYFVKAMELDPTLWASFIKICKLAPNVNPVALFPEGHPLLAKMRDIISSKEYFNNTDCPLTLTMTEQMPMEIEKREWGLEKTPLQKGEGSHYSLQQSYTRSGYQAAPQPATVMIDISPTPPTEGRRSTTKTVIQTPQNPINVVSSGSTPGIAKRLAAKGLQAPQKGKQPICASTSSNNSMKGMMNSEEVKAYGALNEPMVNPFVISAVPSSINNESESSLSGAIELASTGKSIPRPFMASPNIQPSPFSAASHTAKAAAFPKDVLALLRQFAVAYHALATYKCADAIVLFKKLPKNHYNTGWTLCQVGRALFETIRYAEAEKAYSDALKVEPYRLEGLEYHSTCLWHLRKQVDLCKLANYALAMSLYAPETWCTVGNLFSLQKEHETALRFFSRAIQLNPYFAYAHTLCGHEYVSNEDFEQAKKCYQRALSVNDKHYNAWWGMGNIYLKQERYDYATQYFKSAIKINSKSSVLHTYLGMTYFRSKQPREALECFEIAERMDPNNPLNRYQKATVLMSLNQLDRALAVLEELTVKVPREAPIHILIGKICWKLGNKDKALAHYNIAMDLDPKEANMVKSLIDKLDRENDINEENDL